MSNIISKNILSIKSDGTSLGTKIKVNDTDMHFISNLEFQISVDGLVHVHMDSFFNDINLNLEIPDEIKEALLKIQNFTASQNYFRNKGQDET